MRGGLVLTPSRVHKVARLALESQAISQPPCWFKVIGKNPPPEMLTRTQPVDVNHTVRAKKSKSRKPSKSFQPIPIVYEEDQLRHDFFADHPWELARPRIVLENDGKDGNRCDWSRIKQRGRPLNGESVVQRQLWLMKKQRLSKVQAYDVARKEFYALRHAEEVEKRVTREEAMWVGAQFNKGTLEVGMELEDKVYEKWKVWAQKEVDAIELSKQAMYAGLSVEIEEEPELGDDDVPKVQPLKA